MKTNEAVLHPDTVMVRGFYLMPLVLAAMVYLSGCASVQDAISMDEQKTHMAIPVQSPPALGTVTSVSTALMAGKELRRGDIALTVDLDDGQVIVVVQPEDNIYTPGDRVRVIRDGNGLVTAQVF